MSSDFSDELLDYDYNTNEPKDSLTESDLVPNTIKPISEIEKNNYNVVDVVHDGKFDFEVGRNSIRFEKGYGATQTIVRV